MISKGRHCRPFFMGVSRRVSAQRVDQHRQRMAHGLSAHRASIAVEIDGERRIGVICDSSAGVPTTRVQNVTRDGFAFTIDANVGASNWSYWYGDYTAIA